MLDTDTKQQVYYIEGLAKEAKNKGYSYQRDWLAAWPGGNRPQFSGDDLVVRIRAAARDFKDGLDRYNIGNDAYVAWQRLWPTNASPVRNARLSPRRNASPVRNARLSPRRR